MLITINPPAFAGRKDILKKARISFLREEYQQTVRECERLLLGKRLDSNTKAELYYLIGVSYLKQDSFSRAKDSLLRVISRYPQTEFADDAYLSLGDGYLLGNKIDVALKTYRTLLAKYPGSELLHLVYYRLGECYYRNGRWGNARNYLNKVTQKYPLSFEADLAKDLLEEGLYFTVQVGAFVNKGNAQELCNKLIARNYPAYISSLNKRDKTFYRLRVGKFDSREQAKLTKNRLKKDGFSAQIYP